MAMGWHTVMEFTPSLIGIRPRNVDSRLISARAGHGDRVHAKAAHVGKFMARLADFSSLAGRREVRARQD